MLTMKAKYALRALAVLADAEPAPRQARQIAEQARIPGKFLEAILVQLRKAGLVESKRGALGGHRLSRPAAQITIGEIVRSIDGPIAPLRCASITAYRPCVDCADPGNCALRRLMGDVREAMSEVIDQRSLRQLSDDTRRLGRKAAAANPLPQAAGGSAWTPAAP
jgi:Rrf2 family protein